MTRSCVNNNAMMKDEVAQVDLMGRGSAGGGGELRIEIVVMVIVDLCKVGSGVT